MSIHDEIREARKRLGWSMEQLAAEISKAEGLHKPLSWQTVQQWENGASAPKRTRMEIVARLLGLETDKPAKGEVFHAIKPEEWAMLQNYRKLLDKDRAKLDAEIAAKAEERQAEFDEFAARFGVQKAVERANARRQAGVQTQHPIGDKLKQQSLLDDEPPPEEE
jgi:transcriptional regulator with XRE-family HTH domain